MSSKAARRRIAACALGWLILTPTVGMATDQPHSADLDAEIVKEAKRHGIPERLVRRVVMRESRYNPRARNHKYWGLMQISYPTARSMGFRGTPEELLNPVTNLTYAVPYLANAFIAAGKREDAAIRLYASGYYDTARRHGLLGLMRTADSTPLQGFHDEVAAAAAPEASSGIFGALFGSPDPAPTLAQQPAPQLVAEAAPPAPAAPPPAAAPMPQAQVAPTVGREGRVAADVATSTSNPADTDMVADKAGRLGPPTRWRHDGGFSVIARGEQSDTHRLASADAQDGASHRRTARHSRKVTAFASADLPAAAQAYAATAAETAPPQAAIEQAVSQAPSGEGQAAPSDMAAASAAVANAAAPATAPTETKAAHHHRVTHAHGATHHTAVAAADTSAHASATRSTAPPAKAVAELK